MNIFLRVFFILLLVGAWGGRNVPLEAGDISEESIDEQAGKGFRDSGQEGSPVEESGLDDFKQKMISAAKEHDELLAENRKLKKMIGGHQSGVNGKKQDRGVIPWLEKRKKKEIITSNRELSVTSLLLEENRNKMIKEAQDIYLSGLKMDLGDAQKLRELYLYDLQFQKQELELDIQLKEYWIKNVEDERYRKLDARDQEISSISAQEQELSEKVAELERAAAVFCGRRQKGLRPEASP